MEANELIDLICPEHTRTSCSDDDISNGFYMSDDDTTISIEYYHRCNRCALLQIANGTIKINEYNKVVIPTRFIL